MAQDQYLRILSQKLSGATVFKTDSKFDLSFHDLSLEAMCGKQMARWAIAFPTKQRQV